ncbi:aminotransferase class I/II-fold pyridoxal phosphate-dependent enzyme [Candidatus Woesearchaeota archaeon]|nr:aminotransferase class I/II-fold pyridoxal phosphate-dependent enzyme [Candidatus Woesearchaeota archaeon]
MTFANDIFSRSMENVGMSPIVSISELVKTKANEFRMRTGKDFILFQRGEVDFPTPQYIKDAARKALDDNRTKYPLSGGEVPFKEAILRKLHDINGANGLSLSDIVVTYAGQEALQLSFNLFRGERGAGFSPCWSCALENFAPYTEVDFTEVPLREDFSIDWKTLEPVLKSGIRFFYYNSPHNPTGKVFKEEETRKIADLCYRNGVYLLADEAYERIVYEGKHFSASAIDLENIISCFTLSKTYAMTGWRLGYLVTRHPRISQLVKLGNYSQTAGVATFLQYAGKEALDNREEEAKAVTAMVTEFKARRDVLYDGLRASGIDVQKPEGAFYMFPNFGRHIPKGVEHDKYIFNLLMEHGIATVYGSCFGKGFGDNIRLSFSTTPVPVIQDAIGRFRKLFL